MNGVNIQVMGTRTYHHGALAGALVDEALAQIRVEGAERVTLRGVAQAVGVSPSAAYNHFADKDALLAAVIAACFAELDRRLDTAVGPLTSDDDATAIRRLRVLAEAYVAFAHEDPNVFRHAFGPHCADEPKGGSHSYELLEGALDDLDARGLLRPGARAGLDFALWSLVHGFSELALNGAMPWEGFDPMLDSFERAVFSAAATSSA